MNDAIAAALAIVLLLVCGLYWKLAALPARLWSIARCELDAARHEDDAAAHKALQEATDARVGALVAGLRQYQQQTAADFRKQIADAQLRARLAERNAADATTALETATALVREVRATLDGLGELPALLREAREARAQRAPQDMRAPTATVEAEDSRSTIEIRPPAGPGAANTVDDGDGSGEPEECTKVFPTDTAAPSRRAPGAARRSRG